MATPATEDIISAVETINASTVESGERIATNGVESAQGHQSSQAESPASVAESGVKRKRDSDDPKTENSSEPKSSSQHPLYKTSLCSFYRQQKSDSCSYGESCRFAHSEEELRPRPDGSWDPTSERAKKLMKVESGKRVEVEKEEELQSVIMTDLLAESDDPKLSKCLLHLPLKWSCDQIKKFLVEQDVQFKSARKKKGMAVGFVSFETAEEVKRAVEVLDGKSVGSKIVEVVDVIPRSCDDMIRSAQKEQQRRADESGNDINIEDSSDFENNFNGASFSKARSARDVVTPLADLSYPEQLEQKKNSLKQMLKKLTGNARKACPRGVPLPEWIVKSREIGGLPCQLEGILESPCVNGYRNKCEFTVGSSMHGKPIVGFMLGNFREGVTAVEEPTECPNVSEVACKYALLFQQFLQDSALPIWNRFNNTGFWRQLTVREGRNVGKDGAKEVEIIELLLMVQVCSFGFDDNLVNSEFEKMSHAFAAGASLSTPPLPLKALVVQDHRGISNVAPSDCPLRQLPIPRPHNVSAVEASDDDAEGRIHDYIGKLCFSISPTAFFQVNTPAAERLYSIAGDWADLGPETLLFDVCCGTGTIGLTLANRVGMVVGIEMNASAVSDAERNAKINGIKNCRFVCSKAEKVMGSLLKEYLNAPEQPDETSDALVADGNDGSEIMSVDNEPHSKTTSKEEIVKSDNDESEAAKMCGQEVDSHLDNVKSLEDKPLLKQQFKNVVAIVDPPRGGLHPVLIRALRTHPRLQRLVYISCNPETLVANAIELCTPSSEKMEKRNNGGWRKKGYNALARQRAKSMPNSVPFKPVKAMAVDMFPHTTHCEMVMLLER